MPLKTENIKKAIEDISSLEVATLTNPTLGNVDLSTAEGDKIFDKIKGSLKQAELVAYSRFELDGDAVNYISQKEELAPLVEKHSLLVSSALETRKALFGTIFNAVKNLIQ